MVGCHNTHRVTALQAIGGFAAHDADDLLTALMYLAHGWRGVYVPETLATGLTPVSWTSYFTQQRRWARSVFDLKLRVLPDLRRRLQPGVWWRAMLQGVSYIGEAMLPLAGVAALCAVLLTGHDTLPLQDHRQTWCDRRRLASARAARTARRRRGGRLRLRVARRHPGTLVAVRLDDGLRRRAGRV